MADSKWGGIVRFAHDLERANEGDGIEAELRRRIEPLLFAASDPMLTSKVKAWREQASKRLQQVVDKWRK